MKRVRVTICILLAVAVSVLAFNGCRNPFNSTSGGPVPQPGMGVFSLTIAGQGPARTIAPVWPSGSLTHNLKFEPNVACTNGNLPFTVDNWQREPIDLPFGLWDLTVTAYVQGNPDRIAEGVSTDIIDINPTAPVVSGVVELFPVAGDGTFEWNIITDVLVPLDVPLATARMVITPVGGSSAQTFYFEGLPGGIPPGAQTVANPGSRSLPAGQYRVVFTLINEDGQRAVLREVLHVHANMTSYFSQAIGDEHFPTSLLDMILSGWDDNTNTWDFDFGASGSITYAHFGHLGIVGIENSNFSDIVDAFDTLTANNQPPEDLDELKELTDAALIKLGAASHLEAGEVRRRDAQDEIRALALNGTLIPDSAFNWSTPGRVTITAGGYSSEFNVTATIFDHIVTFMPNGGTGASVTQHVSGSSLALGTDTRGFSRIYHDLSGWRTQPGSGGILHPLNTTLALSEDITLFAEWYRPTLTVSFNANGGTGGTLPTAMPVLRGNYATLPGWSLLGSVLNHHFVGWNTHSDGTGMTNLQGSPFRVMEDTTLYAEWAENPVDGGGLNPPPGTFTVTLWPNGASGDPLPFVLIGAPDGTVMALPVGGFTRTDHEFIGWSENVSGGIILPGGAPFNVTEDIYLYAQWREVPLVGGIPTPLPSFTVTLAPNGGLGETFDLMPVPGGTTIALPGGGFARQWHDQVGWGSTPLAVGATPTFPPDAPIAVTADMTLYAVWYRPTDTISFHGNGGIWTGTPAADISGLRGTEITLPGDVLAWPGPGFDLMGWSTLAGDGGNFYALGGTFTIRGTATLFARWEVPIVTGVTVTPPSTATAIRGGQSEPFTAEAVGTGNIDRAVTWGTPERVPSGAVHGGTSFNPATGIFTVSAYEPPGDIRVRATSTANPTHWAYATVTVPHPTVTGVTIVDWDTPRAFDRDNITPVPIQFTASVTGVGNPQPAHFTLAWTVEGAASPGTAINALGLLNVPRTETSGSLTVRVTATAAQGGTYAAAVNPATVNLTGTPPAGDWSQVSVGIDHTVAIDWEGRMWAWGRNDNGQLGNGNTTDTNRPVRITVSGNNDNDVWVQVDAGWAHTVARRNDGTIWGWGNIWSAAWGGTANIVATMGSGSNTTGLRPALVPGSEYDRWNFVAAGHSNVFAIREDGTLFSMGRNQQGQLGRGAATGGVTNTLLPVTTSNTDWTYISASQGHILALRGNGELWAWGLNDQGRLGTGVAGNSAVPLHVGGTERFTRVGAGSDFSVGINMAGQLLTWGGNAAGQLGTGSSGTVNTLIPTIRNTPILGSPDFHTQTWSFVRMGQTSHVLAVTSEGEIWSWGNNSHGQIGNGAGGTGIIDATPARRGGGIPGRWATSIAGGSFSLAIQEDGRMYGWGHNTYGMLGLGHIESPVTTPTFVPPQP